MQQRMSNDLLSLSPADLASVTGGFTQSQIKTIEKNAVTYARHQLGGGPVFLGDVNNSVSGPTFSAKKGVLVSTGDEAGGRAPQFYVGRVHINKSGSPTSLEDL
jgi:hypothetical protein